MEENDFFWFKQEMEENNITQPDIFHSKHHIPKKL